MSTSLISVTCTVLNQSTCNAGDASVSIHLVASLPAWFTYEGPILVTGPNGYSFTYNLPTNTTSSTIDFTLSNLFPGTYTVYSQAAAPGGNAFDTTTFVILADQNCTDPGGNPCFLAVTGVQTDCTCHGTNDGTCTVTLTGGIDPITYFWSGAGSNTGTPGITDNIRENLAPGKYTVSIADANGCVIYYTFLINDKAPISVNAGFQNPQSCDINDGIITANPTGGTGPYNIAFYANHRSDTFLGVLEAEYDNLPAGTYNITVTDSNGCTGTQKITLYCLTDLQGIIIRAKCCMADVGYKLLKAKSLGKSDTKCFEIQMQYLNLAICLLERYLSGDTCADITQSTIDNIIEQLNKICGCCDCDYHTRMLDDTI